MAFESPSNRDIAVVMDNIANLLEMQHANPFKVRAYRTGAKYVRNHDEPLSKIVHSGDGVSFLNSSAATPQD